MYLRLVSTLKTAEILGYIALEAMSEPKFVEKNRNKSIHKRESKVFTKMITPPPWGLNQGWGLMPQKIFQGEGLFKGGGVFEGGGLFEDLRY